jgi:hypothetical protein
VLPNLVIAGVNKAGTTSLFAHLSAHPEVFGSSVKETCHFLPLRYGQPLRPLDDYERYFIGFAGQAVVMEATPGYFYGGRILAEALRDTVPGVRVVILLREPVSRLVSFFRFQQSRLALPAAMTLEEYVRACDALDHGEVQRNPGLNPYFGVIGGRYDLWLGAWMETFGGELKVLFADDFYREPQDTLVRVAAWLGIDPAGFDSTTLTTENRTVAYRHGAPQRLALMLNHRLEPLLRSSPGAKERLRRFYYRLNGAPSRRADPETLSALGVRYRPSMEACAALLEAAGVSQRPPWLAGSHGPSARPPSASGGRLG